MKQKLESRINHLSNLVAKYSTEVSNIDPKCGRANQCRNYIHCFNEELKFLKKLIETEFSQNIDGVMEFDEDDEDGWD